MMNSKSSNQRPLRVAQRCSAFWESPKRHTPREYDSDTRTTATATSSNTWLHRTQAKCQNTTYTSRVLQQRFFSAPLIAVPTSSTGDVARI